MNITTSGDFSPGYIFLSPYYSTSPGPYIYDKFGNLVFDGYGIAGSLNAHNFHVCTYQGSDHLCYSQMNQQIDYGIGQALILDSNYRVIDSVQTGGVAQPADMHEFQLLNNGTTALVNFYQSIPYDLSGYGISNGLGWLLECGFQEINVTSGEVLFEWWSTNHVDPSASDVKVGSESLAGDGLTASTGWDYFHMNSVDKSPTNGNYLISARHTSTVYYINGTDRSVIWTLSHLGQSDFALQDFKFSFQHDARIQDESDTSMTISIFDNASNGYNSTNSQSSGKIIRLDLQAKTATLVSETKFPGGTLSTSQGNTQVLPNGGTFHGWGSAPYISEHDASGNPVLVAQYANSDAQNYRAFTFNWTSTPANTVPAVYSYALNSDSGNRIYVSWNGATTVKTWSFYGAANAGAEYKLIGNMTRTGFETEFEAPSFFPWVYVEAVHSDGSVLRRSNFQPTFVPSAQVAAYCDVTGCQAAMANST